MSADKYVAKAYEPEFYTRVGFLALVLAGQIAAEVDTTTNHINRVNYAGRVLRGDENLPLLAMHLIAAASVIQTDIAGGIAVTDARISQYLVAIWNARSNAFADAP